MSVFSVDTEAGDIEAVMDAVADVLRRWEGGDTAGSSVSLFPRQSGRLCEQARQLQAQWNIDATAIIHSTRPRAGPWLVRFQILVRRLTWWFLEPVVQQIRRFQMNAAQVIEGLAQNQEQWMRDADRLDALTRRVEALEARWEAASRDETPCAGESDDA